MSEYTECKGFIEISDEVVAAIAVTAALEVDGVCGNPTKGFAEFLGKKGYTKCTRLAREEGVLEIDLDLVVKFGAKVQMVAQSVQESVKNSIETMTGMEVSVVNVAVNGIMKEKAIKVEKVVKEEEAE